MFVVLTLFVASALAIGFLAATPSPVKVPVRVSTPRPRGVSKR